MGNSLLKLKHQQGFTLVELMIALTLGLLVSAAAIQIYLVSVRTTTTQAGASSLQDISIFGIQGLEKELRIANLGSKTVLDKTTRGINNVTPDAGIVLSLDNVMGGNSITNRFDTSWLTRTGNADTPATSGDGWKGVSGTNKQSDQLTIQYTNITGSTQVDCESYTVPVNAKVIERYFLRPSTTTGQGLVLACDAGRVNPAGTGILAAAAAVGTTTPAVPGFGDAGQEIMTNIDQFKVMLGVQSPAGQLSYLSPASYNSLATGDIYHAPIVAVKVGIIARSAKPIFASNTPTTLRLFGEDNVVSSSSSYLRRTYESTTMLRNAQVVKTP